MRARRRSVACYGRIPDVPDKRDFKYEPPRLLAPLPPRVDLRRLCPPPFDQGSLGSCTANAVAAAVMVDLRKQRRLGMPLSRLFIYYHERVLEGTVRSDAGAQARDGMKVVAKLGACTEGHWRYSARNLKKEPDAKAYLNAIDHRIASYHRISHDLTAMKTCLASGYPFIFGFTVYASFEGNEVARTGRLDMPARREKLISGHSVLAVGYDDAQRRFTALNSWGAHWGRHGYFTIPYDYLTDPDLADDLWTARTVLPATPMARLASIRSGSRRRSARRRRR